MIEEERSIDYRREMRYADGRIKYIDKQMEKIGEEEKESLRKIKEEQKLALLSKEALLSLRALHFALVEQKVCRTLAEFVEKREGAKSGEQPSISAEESGKMQRESPFDRKSCDRLLQLAANRVIFINEGNGDEIALAKKIEKLTKFITIPSLLCNLRKRAIDYRLADEYLISRKVLGEKRRGGAETFKRYLAKKQMKYGPGGRYADQMVKAREQYHKRAPYGKYGGLSDYMVKKSYRHALIALYEKGDPKGGVSFFCKNSAENIHSSGYFLAGWREEKELIVVHWSGKVALEEGDYSYINEGTFSIVQKAYIVTKKIFGALKFAYPTGPVEMKTAEGALLNEVEKLSGLESEGILERPLYHFQICDSRELSLKMMSATIGKLYSQGDLRSLLAERGKSVTLSDIERAEIACQIFTGLETLAEKNIIHGDIKPENILVDCESGKRKWRADIADFGDARYAWEFIKDRSRCKLINWETGLGTAVTPSYFTREDALMAFEAMHSDEVSEESWRELQKMRDVFAAATSAWQVLTPFPPFHCMMDGFEYPITERGTEKRHDEKITRLLGKECTQLLKEALSENPLERPAAATVAKALRKGVELLRK